MQVERKTECLENDLKRFSRRPKYISPKQRDFKNKGKKDKTRLNDCVCVSTFVRVCEYINVSVRVCMGVRACV